MAVNLNNISRVEKREIAAGVLANLQARAVQGPAEPALDAYIPELTDITGALATHVTASMVADAKRAARLARLAAADVAVDTWYRHIESYVGIEAGRKLGPHVAEAAALHEAAFPDGLAHVDDPVADENRICRKALMTLRSDEHAATIQAIELPTVWLDRWETALNESDAAFKDVEAAHMDKQSSVNAGRDAEAEWVELFVRLRRYVASRAKRSDTVRVQEGKTLLAPLLDTLAKMKAQAAARATRRRNASEQATTTE
ncbi:MAG: hypothetical protein IPM54_18855 [Polyangiaceae bacterium]|nr:hypothetical protein [Polyangiaceae bacterium]